MNRLRFPVWLFVLSLLAPSAVSQDVDATRRAAYDAARELAKTDPAAACAEAEGLVEEILAEEEPSSTSLFTLSRCVRILFDHDPPAEKARCIGLWRAGLERAREAYPENEELHYRFDWQLAMALANFQRHAEVEEPLSRALDYAARTRKPSDSIYSYLLLKVAAPNALRTYDADAAIGFYTELKKGKEPGTVRYLQIDLRIADALRSCGREAEALEPYRAALAELADLVAPDDPELLKFRTRYVGLLLGLDRLDEAERVLAELEAQLWPPAGEDGSRPLAAEPWKRGLWMTAAGHEAIVLAKQGYDREALEVQTRLLEWIEEYGEPFAGHRLQIEVARALQLDRVGDPVAACKLLESLMAEVGESFVEGHPVHDMLLGHYAVVLSSLGDEVRADIVRREQIERLSERFGPTHPDVLGARLERMKRLLADESPDAQQEAEEIWRGYEALERWTFNRARAFTALVQATLVNSGARAALAVLEQHRDEFLARVENDAMRGDLWTSEAVICSDLGLHERAVCAADRAVALYAHDHSPVDDELLVTRICAVTMRLAAEAPAREALEPLVAAMELRTDRAGLLAPQEARNWIARHRRVLNLLLSEGAADAFPTSRVFELVEEQRTAVASDLGAARARGDADVRRLFSEVARARARVQDVALGADVSEAALLEATLERDQAERALREGLRDRGEVPIDVDADHLAEALAEDAAYAAYTVYEEVTPGVYGERRLVAHVLRPGAAPARVDIGPADAVEELVLGWRSAIGRPADPRGGAIAARVSSEETAQNLGDALRTLVLDPVLAQLGDGCRTLHVASDGALHLLPLGALPLEPLSLEDGEVVVDRYRLFNELSPQRLLVPRPVQDADVRRLLCVGGVDYDADPESPTTLAAAPPIEWSAEGLRTTTAGALIGLPGTLREVESISGLHADLEGGADPVLLRGARATKRAFLEHAPRATHLHVATHAWFAGEETAAFDLAPLTLCGLALAGANRGHDATGAVPGILTGEELASLDLTACRLAVLSACETSVGRVGAGQGVLSLQSALHNAGVVTAVTSLWPVDDRATERLMRVFYEELWAGGVPAHEALVNAQRALRESGAPARDWAGWVMTGEGR